LGVAQKSASVHDGASSSVSPTFTVSVDRARGTLRVRGHLDRVGADLLAGTVEELRHLGHRHVAVALAPLATTDPGADEVLAGLTRRLAAEGVRLTAR
jgi:hypothetical protein